MVEQFDDESLGGVVAGGQCVLLVPCQVCAVLRVNGLHTPHQHPPYIPPPTALSSSLVGRRRSRRAHNSSACAPSLPSLFM
jgi:hypothetical protein